MADENEDQNEQADNPADKEDKTPIVPVENSDLEKRLKKGQQQTDEDADDDSDDDSSDDDSAGKDKRAGHAEGEEEGEDARRTTNRERKQERKRRQQEARERNERELNFLRSRNEQLERRFSSMEAHLLRTDKGRITNELARLQGLLEEAKEAKAEAIKTSAGEDVVEADEIISALTNRIGRLSEAKERIENPPARREQGEIPLGARKAIGWAKRNHSWFKPDGSTEESAIAIAVEGALLRDGFNPEDDGYWTELDKRLKRRLPDVFKKARPASEERDDDDEDEEEDPPQRRERREDPKQPAKKSNGSGGPRVSVGGQNIRLKPGEVYISPERKQAMIEAGVWDDPILRERQLRQYQRWDREQGLT